LVWVSQTHQGPIRQEIHHVKGFVDDVVEFVGPRRPEGPDPEVIEEEPGERSSRSPGCAYAAGCVYAARGYGPRFQLGRRQRLSYEP